MVSVGPVEPTPRFAVVGYSARFPGAPDTDEFWNLLRDGRDAISEVPRDRWDADDFFDSEPGVPGKIVTRCAGFVDDVTGFDAPFFGMSTREVRMMDPQHRLLLETAWRAVEHSGTAPSALAGTNTGVFVGLATHDYLGMASDELDYPRSRPTRRSGRPTPQRRDGSASGWGCRAPRSPSTRPAVHRWWPSIRRARRCTSANVTSRWPAVSTSCSRRRR